MAVGGENGVCFVPGGFVRLPRKARSVRNARLTVRSSAMEVADVGKSLGMTSVVFFLTGWGMVSFVKGSTKARIIQTRYTTSTEPSKLIQDAVSHFASRAYRINNEADKRPGVITLEGLVSPSATVAGILLSCAVASLASLVIVLQTYYPEQFSSNLLWLSVLPSVLIVPWYWNGAERIEQVKLLVEADENSKNKLFLKGHRDEIAEYEAAMGVKRDKVEE
eukprot:CAMPEP_0113963854 /NCGR_PEP_ID=MMETSP0011_2-20120614/6769_1 /TAXON_ID=101924 /ORGANISM="Rhodosorus marinus" /LENGTH=220 /DNA_ID=CAMNT_0000975999 /DNA_START=45 /DNA_END=707 /DNA_ORIENTATION=- /assembly_acc=CAM_ASM_000156